MGVGGNADFVLARQLCLKKLAFEATAASKSQDSAWVWRCQDDKEGKNWGLNPCCQQKSRQRRRRPASENHVQDLCRENVRRLKFQGYMAPETHFHKHICTFLTFAGRRGLRVHSTQTWLPKTPAVTYVRVTTWGHSEAMEVFVNLQHDI